MTTYSFTTTGGQAALTTIVVNPAGYSSINADFSDNSRFQNVTFTKVVTPVDGVLTLTLTAEQVDILKSGYFRIVGVKSDSTTNVLVNGSIDYTGTPITPGVPGGVNNIKIQRHVMWFGEDAFADGPVEVQIYWDEPFDTTDYTVKLTKLAGLDYGGTPTMTVVAYPGPDSLIVLFDNPANNVVAGSAFEVWAYEVS